LGRSSSYRGRRGWHVDTEIKNAEVERLTWVVPS
jgi:hypothetical protein